MSLHILFIATAQSVMQLESAIFIIFGFGAKALAPHSYVENTTIKF
jgi:hypothetical protein